MSAYLSPVFGAGWQLFTNAGVVLAGGKIQTYVAGSTTAQATWTDSTQVTQNANPIILDSAGRLSAEVWLQNGVNYKFVLSDANNNILGTWDNISGVNSPSATQSEWVASGLAITYISTTQFSVVGDQTALFQVNRRVQYTLGSGTFYGYVSAVSYSASNTTVTVVADSTVLDNTISAVAYGFISATNTSIPQQYIIAAAQANPTPSTTIAGQVVQVNAAGTGYTTVVPASSIIFALRNFY